MGRKPRESILQNFQEINKVVELSHFQRDLDIRIICDAITQNLVASFDQQLKWAIQLVVNEGKFDSSRDLKIQYHVIPSRHTWFSNAFVISGGCHKIHSLHSKLCHSLISLCLKTKELVNWIVKSDIELPFSKVV